MRHLCGYSLLLLLVAFAPAGLAQTCEQNETIGQCMAKFVPPVSGDDTSEAAVDADAEKTEDATASAATGITNVVSASESSLKDFLTLFAATLETATTSQQGQAFTFDWNPKLAFAPNLGAKLQASFAATKINDEVSKSLAANTEKLKELEDSLEFGDDTTLSGFLEPESPTHGRSIDSQRAWFRIMRDAVLEPRLAEDTELLDLMAEQGIISNKQRFESGIDPNDKAKIDARIEAFVELFRRRKEARAERDAFFMAFAKLLNNQPQFYGAAIYHARRNVIGPNEWSGKFTYEYAGRNLNHFRKDNPECTFEALDKIKEKDDRNEAAEGCVAALKDFAEKAHSGIERITFSVEGHKVNRRWIKDPDLGLDQGFPATRSFVGTLAFGTTTAAMLPLRTEKTGVGDARLDFTAKYELPENNDKETRGFVGSLTYTQKISATFSLPISLVYSDHESDLLNVQKRFSTKFGLMYKLPDLK